MAYETVGFDWHPETKELWFTDNGRDLLGDDVPPDELNHAPKPGMHFGFPYCHSKDIADPEFGAKRPCKDFVAPTLDLGPHVAALGMRFYTGTMFPPRTATRSSLPSTAPGIAVKKLVTASCGYSSRMIR